jgi:plasmid maintenance system killer protein
LFRREAVRRFKAIERQALRKLDMLDAAPDLRNALDVARKSLGTP